MKKSVEQTWKEGFKDENALVPPQVVDLYNRKSQNLVDKFNDMFKTNRSGVIFAANFILVVLLYFNLPFLGIFIFLNLISLVIFGRRQLKELNKISKTDNSYRYVKSFDQWLKKSIAEYTIIYQFFYPIVFLGITLRVLYSSIGDNLTNLILDSFSETYMIAGIPLSVLVPVILITALLAKYGGCIYQWDVRLYYGAEIDKLDEIVAEMELLQV